MDSTLISGLIGLVGAIIGAWIAGRYTATATKNAFELNTQYQIRTQKENVRGFLLSIRSELEVLWETYDSELGEDIENLRSDQDFKNVYPLSRQEYFPIFKAGATLLGQVPDDELRKIIIQTYTKGTTIIETHIHYNKMVEEREQFHKGTRTVFSSGQIDEKLKMLDEELIAYSRNIKINFVEMKQMMKEFYERLNRQVAELTESLNSQKFLSK